MRHQRRPLPGIVSDLARRLLETLQAELRLWGVHASLLGGRPPALRADLPGTVGESVHVHLAGDAVQYRWNSGTAWHPVEDPAGAASRVAESLADRRRRARAIVRQASGGDGRVDALLMLSGPLRTRGYRTEVSAQAAPLLRVDAADPDGRPYGVTVLPGEPAVYVGWGERISPVTDVEGAADRIAAILGETRL